MDMWNFIYNNRGVLLIGSALVASVVAGALLAEAKRTTPRWDSECTRHETRTRPPFKTVYLPGAHGVGVNAGGGIRLVPQSTSYQVCVATRRLCRLDGQEVETALCEER